MECIILRAELTFCEQTFAPMVISLKDPPGSSYIDAQISPSLSHRTSFRMRGAELLLQQSQGSFPFGKDLADAGHAGSDATSSRSKDCFGCNAHIASFLCSLGSSIQHRASSLVAARWRFARPAICVASHRSARSCCPQQRLPCLKLSVVQPSSRGSIRPQLQLHLKPPRSQITSLLQQLGRLNISAGSRDFEDDHWPSSTSTTIVRTVEVDILSGHARHSVQGAQRKQDVISHPRR
mmetsp:Transcript_30619/g.71559  ORF Transcript_30619/g.71559 Transcript_30619/m.71559 type:complete len:237 (-) Transcript_30619:979-1689(-)